MPPEATPEPENEPIQRPDVEARRREIERIAAEIAQVRGEIEAGRMEPVELTAEEQARREAWEAMEPEEKLEATRDLRGFLEENRDEIAAELPKANVDEAIAHLALAAERVERLVALEEELMELVLQTQADQADVSTRMVVRVVEMMGAMENFTEEDWQKMEPAARGTMVDLLTRWHNGQREVCLSQLPIELRRRYE